MTERELTEKFDAAVDRHHELRRDDTRNALLAIANELIREKIFALERMIEALRPPARNF